MHGQVCLLSEAFILVMVQEAKEGREKVRPWITEAVTRRRWVTVNNTMIKRSKSSVLADDWLRQRCRCDADRLVVVECQSSRFDLHISFIKKYLVGTCAMLHSWTSWIR